MWNCQTILVCFVSLRSMLYCASSYLHAFNMPDLGDFETAIEIVFYFLCPYPTTVFKGTVKSCATHLQSLID